MTRISSTNHGVVTILTANHGGLKMTQKQLDHHANQSNPNNPAFKAARDNHANQLNPNNPEYKKVHPTPSKESSGSNKNAKH